MINSSDRKKLRALAHHLEPSVIIGKRGYNDGVRISIEEILDKRELIKVKFNEHKDSKKMFSHKIESDTKSHIVGMIGNITILYRQNPDTEKRSIKI